MRTVYSAVRWCSVLLLFGIIASFTAPQFLWADGSFLDNPPDGGLVSGISVISGWKCPAGTLTFTIDNDNAHPGSLVYGSARGDTQQACGDINNGFVALWNWGLVPTGQHTIRLFDGVTPFAQATFTVTNLGSPFVQGLSGAAQASNFPRAGQDATLQWQENAQNFVISSVETPGGAGICATQTGTVTNFLTGNQTIFTITNPCAGGEVDIQVATPKGNNGAFSLCSPLLNFVQGQTQFSSSSFVWNSSGGGSVCGAFLAGTTTQTTVALKAGATLDFTKSFSVVYDQVQIADFH